MCGRFTLKTPVADWLADLFPSWLKAGHPEIGVSDHGLLQSRYNIAPTQSILVAWADPHGAFQFGGMRWGLVPAWADSLSAGYNMINARSESISDKPSFRPSLLNKRCVVLADGYYEWKKVTPKIKEPYWIYTAGEKVFAMAGLWAENRKIQLGTTVESKVLSATIITTASSEDVREVHDRMPVILVNEEQVTAWLDPTLSRNDDLDQILHQLRPLPSGQLQMRHVSKLVNSPANDNEELLHAVQ